MPSGNRKSGSGCTQCHWNEVIYILLSTAWLSRHLIQRIICTTETNTSTSHHGRIGVRPQHQPILLSFLYKVWIWICFGGQYFDIPTCPIQLALHGQPPSSSLNTLSSSTTTTSTSSNLGNKKNTLNSTIRNIIQTTNVKTPVVGIVDHHHHQRTMSKSYSDSLVNRKTPPIHRTYIVQVFFIVPMIVVPISITKLFLSSLKSRKRLSRGYYDSDDDDIDTTDRRRRRRNERDDIDNARNSDYEYSDTDEDNAYIKIHFSTQTQVNSYLDVVWKYAPPAQFVVFFIILSFFAFIGFQFYTYNTHSLAGSTNGFKGNKRFGYENYAKYNNPGMNSGFQPYAKNLYPGGPSSSSGNFGSESTILNAELMAQRFEMKQRQMGNEIGGSPIYHSMRLLFSKTFQTAEKLHMKSWKQALYSPWGMLYMISLWGVVASLLLFGRVMLPIPDLTMKGRESLIGKGANVRYITATTVLSYIFISHTICVVEYQKSHKQKRKEKSWCERYMPITTGNRFQLYLKVIIVRIIESVIVCAIIPQSSFMCKATGHCNIEPTIFETGDPAVIQSRLRGESNSMFDNLIYDHLAANLITISIIVTSSSMLLCQLLVLDRSSLSLEAHNCVQGVSNNAMRTSDSIHRRGGKKHTSSGHEFHKFWNENTSSGANATLGDMKRNLLTDIKDAVYGYFSLEIGALSTSHILSYIFYAYTTHALIVVMLAMFYFATGRDWYPLVLTLIAIFTAAGGSDVETADFDELDLIARDINTMHRK